MNGIPAPRMTAKVAVSAATLAIDKLYDYLVPEEYREVVACGQRVIVPFGGGNRRVQGFIVALEADSGEFQRKPLLHIYDDGVGLSKEDISLAVWMRSHYYCTFFDAAGALMPPGVWSRANEVFFLKMPLEQAVEQAGKSKIKLAVIAALDQAGQPLTAEELAKQADTERIETHLKQLMAQGVLGASQDFSRKIGDKTIRTVTLDMDIQQARELAGTGRYAEKRRAVIECLHQGGTLPEKEVCYMTGAGPDMLRRMGERGILRFGKEETYRKPVIATGEVGAPISLNPEQQAAFDGLSAMADSGTAGAALLYGVTGSGKTAVYIRLIQRVRASGRQAILLVPEIALTPQMVRQFCLYFGDEVAVMHSSLTMAQRYDEYKRIRAGKANVIIGTRTAVFAPVSDLGVLILDEEQEPTYKSESAPRYHARDVAKFRCVHHKCLLVLGSATPSVESFHAAEAGKYKRFDLVHRYHAAPLPQVIIEDKKPDLRDGNPDVLGSRLTAELQQNLDRGEQSILYINRRGTARMAICLECGEVPECENCSVKLTYHAKNGRLMCHHCGYSVPLPDTCPECGGRIQLMGAGTQRLEQELNEKFPDARVIRMDADTTEGRTSHEKLLEQFGKGEADILVGTQMVAKGLDFENVTLVGVADADLSLFSGDTYAAERVFSLLTQVVGRSGRRGKAGRAVIQTMVPENPVIRAAAQQDYLAFYSSEIENRRLMEQPPFTDTFVFMVTGQTEHEVNKAALRLSATLQQAFDREFREIAAPVLGPVPAILARINKRYRYQVSFRGRDDKRTRELVMTVLTAFQQAPESRTVTVTADKNPYTI